MSKLELENERLKKEVVYLRERTGIAATLRNIESILKDIRKYVERDPHQKGGE